MEIIEILYIALGTIGILVVLHLGTFWVSRIMQPPKPKIVYVQAPQPVAAPVQAPVHVQAQAPMPQPVQIAPQPAAILSQSPQSIQLPTYELPPPSAPQNTSAVQPLGSLPPPIETRNATKQSGGDLGAPR
jgi:hypothetical protein